MKEKITRVVNIVARTLLTIGVCSYLVLLLVLVADLSLNGNHQAHPYVYHFVSLSTTCLTLGGLILIATHVKTVCKGIYNFIMGKE